MVTGKKYTLEIIANEAKYQFAGFYSGPEGIRTPDILSAIEK